MTRSRKLVFAVALLGMLALGTAAFAGWAGFGGTGAKGVLCCIKKTCFMAKSKADCSTAGGAVVGTCEECTSK